MNMPNIVAITDLKAVYDRLKSNADAHLGELDLFKLLDGIPLQNEVNDTVAGSLERKTLALPQPGIKLEDQKVVVECAVEVPPLSLRITFTLADERLQGEVEILSETGVVLSKLDNTLRALSSSEDPIVLPVGINEWTNIGLLRLAFSVGEGGGGLAWAKLKINGGLVPRTLINLSADCQLMADSLMNLDIVCEHGRSRWALTVASVLDILKLPGRTEPFRLQGVFSVDKEDQKKLAFLSDGIDIPVLNPRLPVGVAYAIRLERIVFEQENGEWIFTGDSRLRITEPKAWRKVLPKVLEEMFFDKGVPTQVKATVGLSGVKLEIRVERLLDKPLEFPAKVIIRDLAGSLITELDWGIMAVAVRDLALTFAFSDDAPNFEGNFGVGLPSLLNNIFGTDADGKPRVKVFKVYDPSTGSGIAGAFFKIGIKTKPSVGFGVKGSFIEGLDIDEEGTWNVELGRDGEYGAFTIEVPLLNFSGNSFGVEGGYSITKNPAIPLAPLKGFLEQIGLGAVNPSLPDKVPVPLDGIGFIEKDEHDPENRSTWKLQVQKLVDFLRAALPKGVDLPPQVEESLKAVAEFIGTKLPASLLDYLDLKVPKSLTFELDISLEGSVSFGVKADPLSPLRLLFINPSMPLPLLQGVTLREVSFGPVVGGKLFLLTLDADFEQYDLVTLAASVGLQFAKLPVAKNFHRRLKVEDLYLYFVWQSGVPIPIPLFYEHLGIEVMGLEGVQLRAEASFPVPDLGVINFVQATTNLYKFVTDPKARLPEDTPPKLLPRFALSNCYVKLPEYLGKDNTIGAEGKFFEIDANVLVARFFNAIKFMDPGELIEIIPIKYRAVKAGSALRVEGFGPIRAEVLWVLSTPSEFVKPEAYRLIGLDSEKAARGMLGVAPGGITPDTKGLVTFLKGHWQAPGNNRFDIDFGLVAIDAYRFQLGLDTSGELGGVLRSRFRGAALIDPKASPPLQLAGQAECHVGALKVFHGSTTMGAGTDRFVLNGDFGVLDDKAPFFIQGYVAGELSSERFSMAGDVSARLLFLESKGNARLDSEGVRVTLVIAKQELDYGIKREGANGLRMWGKLPLLIYRYESDFAVDPDKGLVDVSLNTYLFADLIIHHISAALKLNQSTNFHCRTWLNLKFLEFTHESFRGDIELAPDKFVLDGKLELFPANSPVQVYGNPLRGRIDGSGLAFDSGVHIVIGFIVLSGNTSVRVNNNLIYLSGEWLGQRITLELALQDNAYFSGSFSLNLLIVETTVSVRRLSLRDFTLESIDLLSRIPGVLKLTANLNAGSGSGGFDLYLLEDANLRLLSGSIGFRDGNFQLDGTIGFPGASVRMFGSLGPRGIILSGSGKFYFEWPFWPHWRIEFGVDIRIDNRLPAIKVEVFGFNASGCLRDYDDNGRRVLALMIRFQSGLLPPVWVVIPFGSFLRVLLGDGHPGIGCPGVAVADEHVGQLPPPPADHFGLLLDWVGEVLTVHAVPATQFPLGEEDWSGLLPLFATLREYHAVFGQGEGRITGGYWVRLARTALDKDIFTELRDRIAGHQPTRVVDVTQATVNFEHDPQAGVLIAAFELLVDGRSVTWTGSFDPRLPEQSFEEAATGILNAL